MPRLIPVKMIPSSLWSKDILRLPPQLVSCWEMLLDKYHLRDRAMTEAPEGFEGGMSKEDTDNHLAWRFTGSSARVMLTMLDPKEDLQQIPDTFARIFSGNRVFLADLPCGSGAASISILSVFCELRKLGKIPRMPLHITIVGGEISEYAQTYARESLSTLINDLEDQAITIEFDIIDWDVCDKGINIPLIDYSSAVAESSFLENFSDLLTKYSWLINSVRVLSVNRLVNDAIKVRKIYHEEIKRLLNIDPNIECYARKQLISQLRFYAMRLSYLATPDILLSLSSALSNYPELYLHAKVMDAIHSQDVSSLIKLGNNAVQAAAQILRTQVREVTCSFYPSSEVELQGLAILRLNGINVKFLESLGNQPVINDPVNQFALGTNPAALMKSSDLFIKEIACLRGVTETSRHKYFLDSAFDRDEHLSFDIIEQLQSSSYF